MARYFSIDSIVIRNGRVFGWGWFLDTDARMAKGELVLTLEDGTELSVPCLDGAARADVAEAYPGVPHAATCGFMLMATTPAPVDTTRGARFVTELADGARHEIRMPTWPAAQAPQAAGAWTRLRAALRERGVAGVLRALVPALHARWRHLRERWAIHRLQHAAVPLVVVLDHDMGGGANSYRERLVRDRIAAGDRVAVVTPQLASLEYEVRVLDARGELGRWRAPDEPALLASLRTSRIGSIELNNLVGFADPVALVAWCVAHARSGTRLTFHLHDFHAVCPAFTLIDADGRYCGVPSLEACRACLPRNAANSLGLGQRVDPVAWRAAWKELLDAADRVIAFSDASARILRRAYPEFVDAAKLEVRPHAVDDAWLRPVQAGGGEVLKVAVIGNISRPKGSDIVAGIVALAAERALALQVVVIGTLQASVAPGPHLAVHGSFDPRELPDLVERYGIDVCLMPSICPETYSFVTDEIMAMQLPIAVFDIGAPAERVARYGRGAVVADITAEGALAAIIALARPAADAEPESEEQVQWAKP
jgi:glycosyltransferase involved in cell wall biosynthesis